MGALIVARRTIAALLLLGAPTIGQMRQQSSPMVEHIRPHTRLKQHSPPGTRHELELGTLYVPPRHAKQPPLLFFFHGGTWLPEVAAYQTRMAVVSIQIGEGSGAYQQAFSDPDRFHRLLKQASAKSRLRFGPVTLAGWSAGCGALRQLLRTPSIYQRTASVICIDGVHTDYVNGTPGPLESEIGKDKLGVWVKFARDAVARRKRMLITHSEIFPGTFASTTETADFILNQLGLKRRPVVRNGPMGTQIVNYTRAGRFTLIGFAGNSAPDHVDQLHSLPQLLRMLR